MKNLTQDWISHVLYWTSKLQLTLESEHQSANTIELDTRDQVILYTEAACKAAEKAISMNDKSIEHLYDHYTNLIERTRSARSTSNYFKMSKEEIEDIIIPVRELSIATLKNVTRRDVT